MSVIGAKAGFMGGAAFPLRAVHFNDAAYLYQSGLTGMTDTNNLTCSFWFRVDTNNSAIFSGRATANSSYFLVRNSSDGTLDVKFENTSANTSLNLNSGDRFDDGEWHHVFFYCNGTTAELYVDGVLKDTDSTFSGTLDMGGDEYAFGALQLSSGGRHDLMHGDIAQFYFNCGVATTDVNKFISGGVKTKDLESDGSGPTGSPPTIFLDLAEGAAVSTFATNKGSGNGWSTSGTLTEASTSPSD